MEVRRGRGGGVFTQSATTDGADPAVLSELRATATAIRNAAELRAIVEPAVAALAAERATEAALERLAGHNAAMHAAADDDYRFMRADTTFHLELATRERQPAARRGRRAQPPGDGAGARGAPRLARVARAHGDPARGAARRAARAATAPAPGGR